MQNIPNWGIIYYNLPAKGIILKVGNKVRHQMFDGINPLPFSDHTGTIVAICENGDITVAFDFGEFDICPEDLTLI